MTASGVLIPTGQLPLDALLQHVITIFELVFPDRIRAYYLLGSSIDGTAVYIPGDALNSSDIDLVVVFKDDLDPHERERFLRCRTACAGLAQLHVDQLDATPVSERQLMQQGHLTLKVASHYLYGEDIRASIPFPSLQAHIDTAIQLSKDHMAELRQRAPADLIPPLTYPDPTGEFYGYDYWEAGYSNQPGTRILVGMMTWAATALVAIHAGQFAATKREAIGMYQTYLHDAWSPLVEAVYMHCKLQWGYLIPQSLEERQQLRAICAQVLGFENYCLASYTGYEAQRSHT